MKKANKEAQKSPYIKPTRYIHDSGFRCFEVGYILKMTKDNRVEKKEVLGEHTDHIHQDYMMLIGDTQPFCINMDLTRDGYIRFFSHGGELRWSNEMGLSSMGLIPKGKAIGFRGFSKLKNCNTWVKPDGSPGDNKKKK